MALRYSRRILSHLSHQRYVPRTAMQLVHDLSIPEADQAEFRQAVQELLDEGQLVLGAAEELLLPPPGSEMVGVFRRHERGFGFLIPDNLTQHGDLFIPPGNTLDALTGDRVRATVQKDRRRGEPGKSPFTGRIVEILQRADKQYVGTLEQRGGMYVVQTDGRSLHDAVIIRDPHSKDAKVGDKVVIELIEYPGGRGQMAEGVIAEVLGEAGEPEVETQAVMRAFGLAEQFDAAVLDEARQAARSFDDKAVPDDREDLTGLLILTIDPPDARDFDDAISLRKIEGPRGQGAKGPSGEESDSPPHLITPSPVHPSAVWELGVHIADVSHFVKAGSAIDREAYDRGNSTYLPRKVIPMLPEVLSNGVCSLQEGVHRFTKSCFIQYDAKGNVVGQRFARTVIRSAKRLTYLEAQALIDDNLREARKHARTEARYPHEIVHQLKRMDELAKVIRKRRLSEGMIVLALPDVELVFDDAGRVVDAVKEDDAFTHTLIEMFMVEANEAAARLFDALDLPMVRRIHPDPDAHEVGDLRQFARVAGHNIPARPSRRELQGLLDAVRGKPAEYAVHLAVLRTLSKAEYSPLLVGHFALASEHYTHFTSPIRRYPDFVVHRGLDAYLDAVDNRDRRIAAKQRRALSRKLAEDDRVPDEQQMAEIGKHCSTTERNSEQAERELRKYLVMELLTGHLGEDFAGTVTGVSNVGVFVQIDRYLVDGVIRTNELPGPANERWKLNPNTAALVAQRSGKSITIGDRFTVRIAKIDLGRRQMDLVIIEDEQPRKGSRKAGKAQQADKSSTPTATPRPRKPRKPRKGRKQTPGKRRD